MKTRMIVIGDVHGNFEALKSVVEDALNKYTSIYNGKRVSKISGFIFAGDYACDFTQGEKCITYIKEIAKYFPVYSISGNRETGMINKYYEAKKDGKTVDWSLDTTMGAPLIDCLKMSDENLKYIYNLPTQMVIDIPGMPPLFVIHKLPLSEENLKMLKEKNITNIICAHTHVKHDPTYDLNNIKVYNPGSVGFTEEGVPGADYGVLESNFSTEGGYIFTTYHIDYDYTKTIENLKKQPELYNQCKGWGYALQYSVETGVNCTVLYMTEKNRISAFAQKNDDKTVEEIIKLYQQEYPEVEFEAGRDGYVDIYNNSLEERVFQFSEGEIDMSYMPYKKDQIKPSIQEDWMYDLALKRLGEFVRKYKDQLEYISKNSLISKTAR